MGQRIWDAIIILNEFDKKISLTFEKVIPMKSKWKLVRLGDVCEVKNGGTPNTKIQAYWNGDVNWATLVDTKDKYLFETKKVLLSTIKL